METQLNRRRKKSLQNNPIYFVQTLFGKKQVFVFNGKTIKEAIDDNENLPELSKIIVIKSPKPPDIDYPYSEFVPNIYHADFTTKSDIEILKFMYDNQNNYEISFLNELIVPKVIVKLHCLNEKDPLTKDNIVNISPRERLVIDNTCFSVMSLYEHIQQQNNPLKTLNPVTGKFFTKEQIKNIYLSMNIINKERNIKWNPTILLDNKFVIFENKYRWIIDVGNKILYTIPKNFDINNKTSENILYYFYALKHNKNRIYTILITKPEEQDIYYLRKFEIIISMNLNTSQKESILLNRTDWVDQNILFDEINGVKKSFNIDRFVSLHDYLALLVRKL